MNLRAFLLAPALAAALLLAPAHTGSRQIFCHLGYHKVIRHHHQVCIRNKR